MSPEGNILMDASNRIDASHKIAEELYKQQAPQGQPSASEPPPSEGKAKDEKVDAEYEVMDDKEEKK